MTRRSICVVTGSRADYGLLYYPMRAIAGCGALELRVVATGMHLAPEFGLTVDAVRRDGFEIDAVVEMLLSSDSAAGIAKSIGLGIVGFADYFARRRPDLLLFLGDRFEILAAANAAMVAGIPMAHRCGGDVTEGAYDESIRHALTKMAHLHFVTNVEAQRRVIQLGEAPEHVHVVGSPGLDFVRKFSPISREDLARDLGIATDNRWLLVTFHPVTRDPVPSTAQLDALLEALGPFLACGYSIIGTQPNADNEGRALAAQFRSWAEGRAQVHISASLGQRRYLSCMAHAAAVIGNSSSGLYEAPSFGVPTVNIGTRQAGRLRAVSVVDCAPDADSIRKAIERALIFDCSGVLNPYGDGHASERIVAAVEACPDFGALLAKSFHDLGGPDV